MKSIGDIILTHFFMWEKFDTRKTLKIKKKIIDSPKSKKAIIFYPYWTGKSDIYTRFAEEFQDYTQVFYDYPNEVMSRDVKVSLKYIDEILIDSIKTIKDLKKSGVKEIILFGSSFGSTISLKLSTMIKVDKLIMNMVDRNLANVIFTSPALTILKQKLKMNGFTLKKLNKIYKPLSFDHSIKRLKNKKIKIYLLISKTDIFCNAKRFVPVISLMDKLKLNYKVKTNQFFGHISSIHKNIAFEKSIKTFIKE